MKSMTRVVWLGLLFAAPIFLLSLVRTCDQAWAHAILLESSPADGSVLAEAPPYVS